MLRYNRKTAQNHGVGGAACFRPALASAPRASSYYPLLPKSTNITSATSTVASIERGIEVKDGERRLDRDEKPWPTTIVDSQQQQQQEQHLLSNLSYDIVNVNTQRKTEVLIEEVENCSADKHFQTKDSIHSRTDMNDPEEEVSLEEPSSSLSSSSSSSTSSSSSSSSSPLALDDRSIANIECLGLRLIHLLANISSVETMFSAGGFVGCRIIKSVRANLRNLISECLQRLVNGLDDGLRRWKQMLVTTTKSFVKGDGFPTTTTRSNIVIDEELEAMGKNSEELTSKSRGSRHVFMIRHGQYYSKERSDQHKRLTRLGREQLILTGQRLREVGFEYDAVVSSTMTRAKESATIIVDQLKDGPRDVQDSPSEDDSSLSISVDQLLEEGAPLPPEPPLEFWQPNAAQFRADGPRIERAFQKYFARPSQEKDTHEIIVCHANVIRYCVCRALQVPPQAWLRMWLNHGSITWLTIRPEGRIVLRALGASGYMPPEKLTAN